MHFEGPVTIVLNVFAVVVGVALERFLTKSPMTGEDPAQYWSDRLFFRVLFYWASLTILCSLSIRFLAGSHYHLQHVYVASQIPPNLQMATIRWFLKDLAFLLAFGVFLVRAALSTTPESFLMWLIRFLVAAVLWCLLESALLHFWPIHSYVGKLWLPINLTQLLLTLVGWVMVKSRKNWCPSIFTALAVCYVIAFCLDMRFIIEGQV